LRIRIWAEKLILQNFKIKINSSTSSENLGQISEKLDIEIFGFFSVDFLHGSVIDVVTSCPAFSLLVVG
jgi:hypothetical protein